MPEDHHSLRKEQQQRLPQPPGAATGAGGGQCGNDSGGDGASGRGGGGGGRGGGVARRRWVASTWQLKVLLKQVANTIFPCGAVLQRVRVKRYTACYYRWGDKGGAREGTGVSEVR